jgi:hypothetical protein
MLGPVHWLTDDPVTVLHAGLTLNAVLGGATAAVLVHLARRLTPLGPGAAAAAVTIVCLAPAVLFTTDFVFAESLVGLLFVLTLLALLRFHEMPSSGRGAVAALLAGLAFAAHSRMLPLLAVVVGVAIVAAVQRRSAPRTAVAVAVSAVSAVVVVEVATAYVVDRLWDVPSDRNSPSGVLGQLTSGFPVLVSLVGQIWYQLVATLGVVAYGAVVLVRRARGAGADREVADARVLLVTVGACAALSVVFMADRWRSDQLVYGRYNDAVVGPVVLVGLAVLVGAIPVRRLVLLATATAATTVALGTVLWAARRSVLATSNGLEPMILGLQPFVASRTGLDVVPISLWAAAFTLVPVALSATLAVREPAVPSPVRSAAVLGVVGVLVAAAWLRTAEVIDEQWDDAGDVSAVQELREGPLPDGVPVDFHLPVGSTTTNRMMLYQFYLPHTEFTVVHGPDDGTAELVFARLDEDGFRPPAMRLVWSDPRGGYGLFRR